MRRGVRAAADLYRSQGVEDVREIIYPNMRHEILNEPRRVDVFTDVEQWFTECAVMNAVVRTREVSQPVIVKSGKASSLVKGETGEGAGCVADADSGANASAAHDASGCADASPDAGSGANASTSAAADCNANAGASDGESAAAAESGASES